jgi:hypothetical protein
METTVTTAASSDSYDEPTDGYEYPVPENPLTLPTKPSLTPSSTTTTTTTSLTEMETTVTTAASSYSSEETTSGYEYPVPENPLTLPTKPTVAASSTFSTSRSTKTATSKTTLDSEFPIQKNSFPTTASTGSPIKPIIGEISPAKNFYKYPIPENPLTLPPRPALSPISKIISAADATIISTTKENLASRGNSAQLATSTTPVPPCIRQEVKDRGADLEHLANGVPICPVDVDTSEGYKYPVPRNPLLLPTRKKVPTEPPLSVLTKLKQVPSDPQLPTSRKQVPSDPLLPSSLKQVPSDPLQPSSLKQVPSDPPLLMGLKGFNYEDAEGEEEGEDERERRQNFETGISIGYEGRLFSFHIPSTEQRKM